MLQGRGYVRSKQCWGSGRASRIGADWAALRRLSKIPSRKEFQGMFCAELRDTGCSFTKTGGFSRQAGTVHNTYMTDREGQGFLETAGARLECGQNE
jgi:hypothetical protein